MARMTLRDALKEYIDTIPNIKGDIYVDFPNSIIKVDKNGHITPTNINGDIDLINLDVGALPCDKNEIRGMIARTLPLLEFLLLVVDLDKLQERIATKIDTESLSREKALVIGSAIMETEGTQVPLPDWREIFLEKYPNDEDILRVLSKILYKTAEAREGKNEKNNSQ